MIPSSRARRRCGTCRWSMGQREEGKGSFVFLTLRRARMKTSECWPSMGCPATEVFPRCVRRGTRAVPPLRDDARKQGHAVSQLRAFVIRNCRKSSEPSRAEKNPPNQNIFLSICECINCVQQVDGVMIPSDRKVCSHRVVDETI